MANHKSSEKRNRQTIKKRAVNRAADSKVKTFIKKLRTSIEEKDKATAVVLMKDVQSLLAKLGKKGMLKDNAVARKTSRLASQVAKI